MTAQLIVSSEEDAWELLESLNNDEIPTEQLNTLKFSGWPYLNYKYTGVDFDQSVPTRIMPSLLDTQKEIHKVYCQLRYGDTNLRRLKDDSREELELVIKVDKGSSDYKTPLDEKFNSIIQGALSNMDSEHIAITVVSLGLLWTAGAAWKNYLNNQSKNNDMDSIVELSKQETERLKILNDAKKSHPSLVEVEKNVDKLRNSSLHKLKDTDKFSIPSTDINISGKYAANITHTPRAESTEVRIDDDFIILSVDSGNTKGFKLKIQRKADDKPITVTIPPGTLTDKQKKRLQKNEWAKKPVHMEINAKELRGMITTATLVKVGKIKKK